MARKLDLAMARHLLGRAGFTPSFAEIQGARKQRASDVVDELIAGKHTSAKLAAPSWTAEAPLLIKMRAQRKKASMMTEQEKKKAKRAIKQEAGGRAVELKAWWFEEMFSTSSPLTERMTLFWHNHFTSGLRKVKSPVLMYNQNAMLRRHALGSFRDLLAGVARDPAMILYLDNVSNRRKKPNENFARELLELFTLGEGHYTEADIKEAARAFTGWTLDRKTGDFRFARRQHDYGQKTFMGKKGELDGQDILDELLRNPQTSRFITAKLWRELVVEPAPARELERIARAFRESDYQISELVRQILTSRYFLDPALIGNKIKSPVELLVGTVRLFHVELKATLPVIAASRRLGQDILEPPNVKGWEGGERWITTDTLLARQQLITRLFRDPGNMPTFARGGFEAILGAKAGADKKKRAEMMRQVVLPLDPVFGVDDLTDEPFELARQLVLDPVYQLA